MVATQLRPGPGPGAEPAERDFLTYDQFGNLITINFNTLATRQKIRGFSALQPDDPHSPMTSGQPYSTAPEQGDPVTFAVQVHNYSLVDSPSVPVEFFAVPVDHGDISVTGPPQPMGTVSSAPIPSQGAVTVKSPTWTAMAAGQEQQHWRIFAIVDRDNTDEVHPWKDRSSCPEEALEDKPARRTVIDGKMVDPMTGEPETVSCGQNNQGYGIITVDPKAAPAATGTLASTPPGLTTSPGTVPPTFPGTTQVRLDGSGLAFGTQVLLERGDSGRRRSSWAIKSPGWCMPTHRRTSPTIILSSSMTARRPRGGSSRPPPCTGRAQTAAASLGSPGDHRPLASTPFTRSSWAAIRPSTTSRRCGSTW